MEFKGQECSQVQSAKLVMALSSLGRYCLLSRSPVFARISVTKCLPARPVHSPSSRRWFSLEAFQEPAKGYGYSKSHEYASVGGSSGLTVIGISQYAQEKLGDVVYAELPEVGNEVEKGELLGVLESVKAAADVNSPVGGTVAEINTALAANPELVNEDCYEKGWLVKLKDTPPENLEELMSTEEYKQFLEDEVV